MTHRLELRKTNFITEREEELDNLNLQILDSTALPTHSINRFNCIDTNNLIYISGNYVVYYNFFQNSKIFASRVSPNEILSMAINVHGNGEYAIVTQSKDKSHLTVEIYSFNQSFVPTHVLEEQINFVDFAFCGDNAIVIVGQDENGECWVYAMGKNSYEKEKLQYKIKKIIRSERKMHMICDYGIVQFDFEKVNLSMCQVGTSLKFDKYQIDDYVEVQSETTILLYKNILECHWDDTDTIFRFSLSDLFKEPVVLNSFVKVGRNILVSHRHSLTLTHLVVEDDSIKFVNNYVYGQKIKGGILSVQDSLDEMHVALAVQIIEREQKRIQNFMFNLSVFSNSKKYISPFIRLIPNGIETGNFCSFETTLSSYAYTLIGPRITTFQHKNSLEINCIYNLYEIPKFMAVHPLGYQFLCGFDNIIKFYHKTGVDLQEIWCQHFICTAAKYSSAGNLALACIQDSFVSLLLYDCYNFQKIMTIPVSYLKMNINRIQWAHKNQALVLFSPTDAIKINITTGQKLSDFRERKDLHCITCIDYDPEKQIIVASSQNKLLIANKIDEKDPNFTEIKTVETESEPSFIKICSFLKLLFIGTKCGHLCWFDFPLKLNKVEGGKYALADSLGKLKMHNCPINNIGITNNYKFMIVSIKNSGYFSLRMRKEYTFKSKSPNLMFQQLGNLNLNKIEVSSKENQTANKEKLKILLEKRKACFNDFEEFKKEWDLKKLANSKILELNDKGNELSFINTTLNLLEEVKDKKDQVLSQISQLDQQINQMKQTTQKQYQKSILNVYEKVSQEEHSLAQKKSQFEKQYLSLVKKCDQNLQEIDANLLENISSFKDKFQSMKKNLSMYESRVSFEEAQEDEERKILKQIHIQNLQATEKALISCSNDFSVRITQAKKQNQRYCNRKSFLQHKIRFFKEEISKSQTEGQALQKLKSKFEDQLKELEQYTNKKQNRLKVFLKMNDALMKFKNIHETLVKNATKEVDFMNKERKKVQKRIVDVQKELNDIALLNQSLKKQEKTKTKLIKEKQQIKKAELFSTTSLQYWLQEIEYELEEVKKNTKDEDRVERLKQIYAKYYVEKNLERQLGTSKKEKSDCLWKYSNTSEKQKISQNKIKEELRNQKDYILNNFQILNKCNQRIKQEINLNYLQIQTQNYNLIAECNVRKEETVQKRKQLHELIDSVKETQIYMDEMRKEKAPPQRKSSSNPKIQNPIPYVIYEGLKEQIFEEQKSKKQESQFCTKSEASNFIIRRMLDVNKLISPDRKQQRQNAMRRIQTAFQKKNSKQMKDNPDQEHKRIIKPLTATLKNRVRNPLKSSTIKTKSHSKPTLCSYDTKQKSSFAH